ncbi:hypothetical protein [Enterobacter ludwigii]|uniref:hypothetical protein n=1 Tax=Enterobacter ludwigii TaxID=299767 RepID=UPI002E2C2E1E|nr:hypothetical protein [Enterobacter ludwigii]MED5734129.1 hypothetical protein [Enterobacter ludwigii]
MKQKFIEWFTKNNNGCSPAMEDDRSFVREKTQHMFEAYQAGVAEGEARCAALAAENAGLKAALNPEVIPDAAVEAFTETAIMDHDWNETSEWSWVENDTDVIRAVLEAIKPETPATDAFLAEVRAQGVEQLSSLAGNECQRYKSVNDRAGVRKWKSIVILCSDFAAQLRKGVQS